MAPPAYDLAVIGGGINGAGIARDAAGRGARVVLLEHGDLAQGTSSASTKLIHGGLRYLEHREFGLVREALGERETLWTIAPHVIRPLRFVLPHVPGMRPRWQLRAGLWLYDHIGGGHALPNTRVLDLRRDPAGAPLKPGFTRAYEYSDCRVDDARLVVLNACDAANRGADVHTRRDVLALTRAGAVWRIETSDGAFTARAVVNAAGPSVLTLLHRAGLPARHAMRLVRGSHIVVPRLYDHDRAYLFQHADGRIFFAIPYEGDFTLIGTTDADHEGSLDDISPSAAEVAYLCTAASTYFAAPVTAEDVVWSYAGVRPLVDDGSGRPEAATRGYAFELDAPDGAPPLLSVFGGKITTFRDLAQAALAQLQPHLPALSGAPWTATAPLPGGDFPRDGAQALQAELAARYRFLAPATVARLVRSYGTLAAQWLGGARALADLGEDFGHGLSAAEVDYLTGHEWARTAEDILWRRTKLGLRFSPAQRDALTAFLERVR